MARINTKPIRLLISVLLLYFGTIPLLYAQTAQEIARNAFTSTVLLVMEDANGQPLSLGSGFFVRNGEIASNLHVVEGAARGYAKIVGQKPKYDIEGITAVDPERDLVVLKISVARAPTLTLGSSDAVQVGETVYAIGNPQGLEGTFSQGIVSSIREVGTDNLLQITAPISPGSSGGPVLNGKGEVIGVSVATFSGGQNLNFAIPSSYLKTLIGKTGPAKPLVQAKLSKSQHSILASLGGKSTEGVIGENFTYDGTSLLTGEYSFSLVNRLREPVRDIYCLVVFYDLEGKPIDVAMQRYSALIPGGLAKRIKGRVDESVEKLNNPTRPFPYVPNPPRRPRGRVDIRILGFQITD
ncbi:MAG: S1C family serine protease [Desulfobacteraceae bacterium]